MVCEDAAPRQEEVRQVVASYSSSSPYRVVYEENSSNLGYDRNIRHLIEAACGTFVMFMGDDDWFTPGALDPYLKFLSRNQHIGYVLRAHHMAHPDGTLEAFRYLPGPRCFPAGAETCAWMYKRSVAICGVTFRRESALRAATAEFDGTLLYQLHVVLETCLREESVYSDLPVAVGAQTYRDDRPHFGASVSESSRFQPGTVTPENSINFTKGFFEISRAFDDRHGTQVTDRIRRDLSRYSYPFLSIQRKRGCLQFARYARRLARETGLNATWHYLFYAMALLVLGERLCDRTILRIKRRLGHTPVL